MGVATHFQHVLDQVEGACHLAEQQHSVPCPAAQMLSGWIWGTRCICMQTMPNQAPAYETLRRYAHVPDGRLASVQVLMTPVIARILPLS